MSENMRGILLMILSMALFAFEDMFLKWTTGRLPVGEILFLTGLPSTLIFAALARRGGHRIWTRAMWQRPVLLRNLGEMIGSCYLVALAIVPLATAAAVLQALPLAITMGAALFMGAQVGWRRWTAILVGFAGVLLVIQPGADGFQPSALVILLAVAGIALRDLVTRTIPPQTPTSAIAAWGLTSITLLGLVMMLAGGSFVMPNALEIGVLAAVTASGAAGYWAIVAASRTGEVAVVAPFRYTRLVFSAFLGMVAFGERLNMLAIIGTALIILSGLYAFWRDRVRARTSQKGAAAL